MITENCSFPLTPNDVSLMYCNLGPYGVFSFYSFSILSVAGGLALTIIISWLRNLRAVRFTIGNVGICCLTVYVGHMFVAKCLASPFVTFDMTRWLPLTVVQGLILAVITVTVITVATKMYWSWRDKRSE